MIQCLQLVCVHLCTTRFNCLQYVQLNTIRLSVIIIPLHNIMTRLLIGTYYYILNITYYILSHGVHKAPSIFYVRVFIILIISSSILAGTYLVIDLKILLKHSSIIKNIVFIYFSFFHISTILSQMIKISVYLCHTRPASNIKVTISSAIINIIIFYILYIVFTMLSFIYIHVCNYAATRLYSN